MPMVDSFDIIFPNLGFGLLEFCESEKLWIIIFLKIKIYFRDMVGYKNLGLWTIKMTGLISTSAFDTHDLGKLSELLQPYKLQL